MIQNPCRFFSGMSMLRFFSYLDPKVSFGLKSMVAFNIFVLMRVSGSSARTKMRLEWGGSYRRLEAQYRVQVFMHLHLVSVFLILIQPVANVLCGYDRTSPQS